MLSLRTSAFAFAGILIVDLGTPDALAANQTYVVAKQHGPGIDFLTIQDAVDFATDGDVILIHAGHYAPFAFQQKGLTIQAVPGAAVTIESRGTSAIEISDSTPTQTTVLRSLEIEAIDGPGVTLAGDAGVVWLEECRISARSHGGIFPLGYPALRFHDTTRAVLVRVIARGASALKDAVGIVHPAASAVYADTSNVYVYDSMLVGGAAAQTGSLVLDGAAGFAVDDGLVFSARSTVIGGDGVPTPPPQGSTCSGTLGNGVAFWLLANDPEVNLLETQALSGGASTGQCGGLPTNPNKVDSGTVTVIPGFTRLIAADSIVKAATRAQVVYKGKPGDLAFIAYSENTVAAWSQASKGCMFLDKPFNLIPLGVLSGNGTLTVNIPVPALPPGSECHRLFFEGAFFDGSGSGIPYLTNPEPVTIIQ